MNVFKIEYIIYLYMINCAAVLLFNIFYIYADKFKTKKSVKRSSRMLRDISIQISHVEGKKQISKSFLRKYKHRLKRVTYLKLFTNSLISIRETVEEEVYADFTETLRPMFFDLIAHYRRRDEVEQAYLAYVIGKTRVDKGRKNQDGIIDFLLELISKKDVYGRENALIALYRIGNVEFVYTAWKKMQAAGVHHNTKLLADGLRRFKGDRNQLYQMLWDNRKEFDLELVLPIMQGIRYSTGSFQKEFFDIMCDQGENKELRLEAIRYFKRYPFEEAGEKLLSFLKQREYIEWEYAALAAVSLSSYRGENVVRCLKNGLSASNWYVRLNCAEALVRGHKLSKAQLADIHNGKDRYAREILTYVSEKEENHRRDLERKEQCLMLSN